jgi:antibiotic biosynthesis monooxygenase (ABM) superfamily enzyme
MNSSSSGMLTSAVDLLARGITVTTHKTKRVTFVLTVRIPAEGIEDFRAYEDAVLPLLPQFSGRLERRLRNRDGTTETHIVSFASDADFQNYRNDPRRTAQAWLLEKSSAKLELLSMADVS